MPRVEFSALPDSARVWVFGASSPVTGVEQDALFSAVDAHLEAWRAHGVPLVCARDWKHDRFLAIGVDEEATGASGCSIDGLFRVLATIESAIGTSLVGGGTVFWRDQGGAIRATSRTAFQTAAGDGEVDDSSIVFDTTVDTVGAWRARFETSAAESWHARLIKASKR